MFICAHIIYTRMNIFKTHFSMLSCIMCVHLATKHDRINEMLVGMLSDIFLVELGWWGFPLISFWMLVCFYISCCYFSEHCCCWVSCHWPWESEVVEEISLLLGTMLFHYFWKDSYRPLQLLLQFQFQEKKDGQPVSVCMCGKGRGERRPWEIRVQE